MENIGWITREKMTDGTTNVQIDVVVVMMLFKMRDMKIIGCIPSERHQR